METFSEDNSLNKDRIKRIMLFILFSLTIIQQMPVIKEIFYTEIRVLLYLFFGLLSLYSLFSLNQFLRFRFVRYFIFTIIYVLLFSLVIKLFGDSSYNIFELLVPFGILLCSLNTNFNKRQLTFFLTWYVILATLLGVSSIFYYGEGYTITQTYFLSGKNQIGPILGISSIIIGVWILTKRKVEEIKKNQIIKIVLFVALISSILVIRNRASIVGIIITLVLFILLNKWKSQYTLKELIIAPIFIIIFFLASIMGLFQGLIDLFWESLFLNYSINDLNSISAGRTNVYNLSFEFVKEYPILGELEAGQLFNSIPHNYILHKWVSFGILGSLPIVLFYLYLWLFSLRGIFKFKNYTNFTLPLWVLLFSLIVSIFEYTYPYGPGVSQIMVWFLLGQYLKLLKFDHNFK